MSGPPRLAVTRSRLSATLVALLAIACSAARDARGEPCGNPEQRVVAQFSMLHGRDYRMHFPRMGRAPELEHDRPAFVVVFPGPMEIAHFGGYPPLDDDGKIIEQPARDPRVWNVVCVVVNGNATFYTDVDLTGLNYLPGL